MKRFLSLLSFSLLGGFAYASSLQNLLIETESDLIDQLEDSHDLLTQKLSSFEADLRQDNDFNNLVCLGLGKLSVEQKTLDDLVVQVAKRIHRRASELSGGLAELLSGNVLTPVVLSYYTELMQKDVDSYEATYQGFLNQMIEDQHVLLTNDKKRFEKLVLSNRDLLDDLTAKRTRLLYAEKDMDRYSSLLSQWDAFWTKHVLSGNLEEEYLAKTLDAWHDYTSEGVATFVSRYPHLFEVYYELEDLDDLFKLRLERALEEKFDDYLGFYSLESGQKLTDDRTNIQKKFFVDAVTMNCPVLSADWNETAVSLFETRYDNELASLKETLAGLNGLALGEQTTEAFVAPLVTLGSSLMAELEDEFDDSLFAIWQDNEAFYQQRQAALKSVALPYAREDIVVMLRQASGAADSLDDFDESLLKAQKNIKNTMQGEGQLPSRQAAFLSLIYEAIHDYLYNT